jgi:hypothetical protein
MNADLDLTLSRVIKAPRADVWRAWADRGVSNNGGFRRPPNARFSKWTCAPAAHS